ncbi:cytochrome P450 [Nocardia puris]|uniref:cytochrome P450 n=1 Tax=Nocardia puris TaxID=208602 RepID=UPI001895D244|nr:cytochrome P450 [Nocardia puris]MBF6214400.1 cytochrome P450 [Nocardia puris]MBF6369015.1 cytochrome P450 [Nocardia puris]MBF6462837.1 cytochrome P450 [Nocardia puris]
MNSHTSTGGLRARPARARRPVADALAFKRDPLGFMCRLERDHGPVAPFGLAGRRAVMVSGPAEIKEVLVTRENDFDKGELQRKALVPALGKGLLISEGALHARQRRMIAPMFAARQLGPYIDPIARTMHRHIRQWPVDSPFTVLDRLKVMMHDVVGELMTQRPLGHDERLIAGVTRLFEWEMKQLLDPLAAPLWLPTRANRQMRSDLAEVREEFTKVIGERRLDRADAAYDDRDVLDHLLSARDPDGAAMSDEQLIDELINIWGAAHETSADAQFWTAYLLATHPEIRDEARAEAETVLGGRLPSVEDLPRLQYCGQVFKEAMRLFPPAPCFLRESVRDTRIGEVDVAAGTLVFLSTFAMHRSPAHYPDPMTFDPRRFTPRAERARDRATYLPFGIGPRVCIGGTLAVYEGQIFTAVLLTSGELSFATTPVEPTLLINLRPRGDVPAEFRPIEERSRQ